MRTKSLTAVAVLAVALAGASACNATLTTADDCVIGSDLTAGRGGGGAGGGRATTVTSSASTGTGGAPSEACDCPAPINFIPECRVLRFAPAGCVDEPVANGLPCRGGVGVCYGGICAAPNSAGQCIQGPAGPPWVACDDVGDCDDANPCTLDTCPAPGCASCLHVPVQDGTACEAGMVCVQGACCDKAS